MHKCKRMATCRAKIGQIQKFPKVEYENLLCSLPLARIESGSELANSSQCYICSYVAVLLIYEGGNGALSRANI